MTSPARRIGATLLVLAAAGLLWSALGRPGAPLPTGSAAAAAEDRPKAPDLSGGVGWINTTRPVTLGDLQGKVVLLDFWTFG